MQRNDSSKYDGHFNIHTGADDLRKIGQIYEWNHKTHTGIYEGECGRVRGSMGEFFPPNLIPTDSVEIFLQNLCRAMPLDYIETVKIHGVTAFKYAATERALDNGELFTFPFITLHNKLLVSYLHFSNKYLLSE